MSKFSVGEKAIIVKGDKTSKVKIKQRGCVISKTGPLRGVYGNGELFVAAYYVICDENGHTYAVPDDSWLEKYPGDTDSIPESTRAIFTKKQRNPDDVPLKIHA